MWLCNRLSRAANPKAPLSSDETVSYVREITFSCLKVSKCPRIAMNYRVTGSNSSLTNKLLHQSCLVLDCGWSLSPRCPVPPSWLNRVFVKLLLSRVDASPSHHNHPLCVLPPFPLWCFSHMFNLPSCHCAPKTNKSNTQFSRRDERRDHFHLRLLTACGFSAQVQFIWCWSCDHREEITRVMLAYSRIISYKIESQRFASINMLQCHLYPADVW